MRHLLNAVCAAVAISVTATAVAAAADLRLPVKAPPAAPPPVFGWTGFYAGLNAGYGWGDPDQTYTGDASPGGAGNAILNTVQNIVTNPGFTANNPLSLSHTSSGFIGGGQLGYNWQFHPNWVAGIETDIQFADVKGSTFFAPQPPGGVTFALTESDKLSWFGTTRARIGYLPVERLLVYGTGGVAYGHTSESAALTNTSAIGFNLNAFPTTQLVCPALVTCLAGSGAHTSVGWTAGAGFEYAVTNSLTVRFQYLHIDLGSQTVTLVSQAPATGSGFVTAKFDNAYDTVTAGVNFKFGGL